MLYVVLMTLLAISPAAGRAQEANEALWAAARAGDRSAVIHALERGAAVDARARYDQTALLMAAFRGHLEIVRLLIDRGAEVNVQDTFYRMRPLDGALSEGHVEVAVLLLRHGSRGAAGALAHAIRSQDASLARAALATDELEGQALQTALENATRAGHEEIAALIRVAAEARPPAPAPVVTVDAAILQSYAGSYRDEGSGTSIVVSASEGRLTIEPSGQPPLAFRPTSQTTFAATEVEGLSVTFGGRGGMIEGMTVRTPGGETLAFARTTAPAAEAAPAPEPPAAPAAAREPAPRGEPRPWPAFRGPDSSGVADHQGAIVEWDAAAGRNVRWKTPIPGIANSSPIVWGDRIFVTTAISSAGDTTFRTGLYGDVKPVDDLSEHTWKVYALDTATGKVVWERTAHTGVPQVKRHTKASQANSTPVTDGRRVVALFGSIGVLVCYDRDGELLWKKDLGVLDSGWFFDPDVQWGHSSSPVIYRNSVIVQADVSEDSFIAAHDLETGRQLWRTERDDEISTWGTPVVYRSGGRDELVTNGTRIRAYDPATGRLLWTLGPNSEVTVGTPVFSRDLIYVTGGYPPVRPIYAIRPGRTGDLSLPDGQEASEAIAWSNLREGTYIPSPLVYEGLLYTFNNNGIVTAYDAKSGERIYRARVGGGGAFSASPIAADGRLYFASEDGDVFVARAGRQYTELAKNPMGEVIMATPAISDGLIVIRTLGHVYGIGR
jgi:outer membrane protein assembly factor BamB